MITQLLKKQRKNNNPRRSQSSKKRGGGGGSGEVWSWSQIQWVFCDAFPNSKLNDIPIGVKFQFEWHSNPIDIPIKQKFHCEWHSNLSDILISVSFIFEWNSKGLVTPRDYGFFLVKTMLLTNIARFVLPISIILSDIEESTIRFSNFYLSRVQRWLNRFIYITTNCSCCPLNWSSM